MGRLVLGICWLAAAGMAAFAQDTVPTSRPESGPVYPLVLLDHDLEVKSPVSFDIPPDPLPRLLVVSGTRVPDSGGAVSLWIDAEPRGGLAAYPIAPERFQASLPIPPEPVATRHLLVRPSVPGIVLTRVELARAARVRFTIRDQGSKVLLPGEVRITAIDGGVPPLLGPLGSAPREGSSWISRDGHGDLYVPFNTSVTFVGRSSPFRGIARQHHRIDAPDNLLLTFLLPQDELPEDAHIIEGPERSELPALARRDTELALGIGRRPPGVTSMPAGKLLFDAPVIIDRMLTLPDLRFLATNENGISLLPSALHSLVTVELPGGALLHSNGPVPLLEDVHRDGDVVRGWVKARLPDGVLAEKLVIRTPGSSVDFALHGPTTIPLAVPVPSGTPIVLVVTGGTFRGSSLLDHPLAFRVIRAP